LQRFITHILEFSSYLIFFLSLALWTIQDKRGIIKVLSGYYLICALLIAKAAMYAGTKGSNIYLYSILCVLSSFCLGAYFYTVLKSQWPRMLVFLICALNGGYYLLANVIQSAPGVFDSLAYVLLAFSIVVLCFAYIIQLMRNVKEEALSMDFDFWFVTSQLIYFIGSFVIFLTFGYLTKKVMEDPSYVGYSRPLTWLWGLHNVLLFLSSLVATGGILWIFYRKK
jgi:hypothetical protein